MTEPRKSKGRKGEILGMNKNHTGSSKDRTGKVGHWGDNGLSRAVTSEYRDGMDAIFGDESDEKRLKQEQLYLEAQAEKARLKELVYGDSSN